MTNKTLEQLEDEKREVDEMIFICKDPEQRKQLEEQRQSLNKSCLDEMGYE